MKRTSYLISTLVISILFAVSPIISPATRATSGDCDETALANYGIGYYSPVGCDIVCQTSPSLSILDGGLVNDYAGNTVLSDTQIQAIKDNKSVYESSAGKAGIPWEILASVHYRETKLRVYGPENSNGPYQIVGSSYPISDSYTKEQFQVASDDAANLIKSKSGSLDLSDLNNVKFTLFAYNGASSLYVNQALALGFTQQEADNGAGSPYVMNQIDLKRDPRIESTRINNTWGQIMSDGGSIQYPANSGAGEYGAFVIYSLLVGSTLSDPVCNVGKNGDAGAVQAEFATYMTKNSNKYGFYNLGTNGCTTLAAWYIGEHTTLTYGGGHGKDVVGNLVARNPSLKTSTIPVAPSLFSVAGGVATWGASGDPIKGTNVYPGHVGLVVSVDDVKKTAQVLATGSNATAKADRSYTNTYSYPDGAVTFVYLGDNLK